MGQSHQHGKEEKTQLFHKEILISQTVELASFAGS
jgi:hypothetical protein